MKNVEAFVRPDNIKEILENMGKPGALALAGGTTVTLSKDPNVLHVVDLSGAPELKAILEDDTNIELGAMVTMTELLSTDIALPKALLQAARSVSSTPIRNVVTLGGEIARGVYWTDLPVALLALSATVKVCSATANRLVPVKELYESHPSKVIAKNEIITKIYIPKSAAGSAFIKFAKTEVDYAILNIAAQISLAEDGTIADATLALGGVAPLARRLSGVEAFLRGKTPTPERRTNAALLAADAITYRPDFRVSAGYQRDLVQVHTVRILEEALKDSRE